MCFILKSNNRKVFRFYDTSKDACLMYIVTVQRKSFQHAEMLQTRLNKAVQVDLQVEWFYNIYNCRIGIEKIKVHSHSCNTLVDTAQ